MLRKLLEPAATSPTLPFTWRDKRSKRKQVVSGVQMAGGLIAGFVVMMIALVSVARLSGNQPKQSPTADAACWTAVVTAGIIMLWTANRWAPFVTVLFFGPAVFNIFGALLFPPDSHSSSISLSRISLAELLAYSVAVVLLTWRFVDERPAYTTFLDRCALTVFAFTAFKWVSTPSPFPLFAGLLALLAAWCAHRLSRIKRRRRRLKHPGAVPDGTVSRW